MIKSLVLLSLLGVRLSAFGEERTFEILKYVEYPVTGFEGDGRGLEHGHCHLTYERIGNYRAVTVAFNTENTLTKAISSVLTSANDLPLAEGQLTHDLAIPERTLYYRPGLMIMSDGQHLEDKSEITNFYIRADRNLEKIESVRVRFFEDVKRKGRNETGTVICSPADS